ncbi:DUF2285 domain-containing protein [Bradyrhizobium niftali]|jgi:hypothetical protein|uniref:DUF2285 domain-containing protein n=1 Tax=Bradyrhizobium niftali TaxID=2560055 RepID=A0A4Y9LZF1_9BRAD|nr:DUF2285 domain-containing protein [Bradyrhizobium niftali]TFV48218.1 DUF2285 domain-containing protein [Bradyrhizobium niftali]
MSKQPLAPSVADLAPDDSILTPYDYEHLGTYLNLLTADAEVTDWREVSRVVLRIDPAQDPQRAWQAYSSHLARAMWMSKLGHRHLLGDIPSLH